MTSFWFRIAFGWVAVAGIALVGEIASAAADEFSTYHGRHLRLRTDQIGSDEADELIAAFDAAVPQWESFFGFANGELANFRVDAIIADNRGEMAAAGKLVGGMSMRDVPEFKHGFATPRQLFVIRQPSAYYTRHLLLHEGAHAVALTRFGALGPTWYAEGLAEMLGIHRWENGNLELNIVPRSADESPHWGRFKVIRERRDQDRIPTPLTVMKYGSDKTGDVEAYAWSWVLVAMLNAYQDTQPAVWAATESLGRPAQQFNRGVYRSLADQWQLIRARWRMATLELDYGFDWSRQKIDLGNDEPVWNGQPVRLDVRADRGWQTIGFRIPAGRRVRLSATGRVTLADKPRSWISESPGVTIRYHGGRPLGRLLGCLLPHAIDRGDRIAKPEVFDIGESTTVDITRPSWLLVRVNDAPGELSNNRGAYALRMEALR